MPALPEVISRCESVLRRLRGIQAHAASWANDTDRDVLRVRRARLRSARQRAPESSSEGSNHHRLGCGTLWQPRRWRWRRRRAHCTILLLVVLNTSMEQRVVALTTRRHFPGTFPRGWWDVAAVAPAADAAVAADISRHGFVELDNKCTAS